MISFVAAVVVGFTLHEWAHARAALALGDSTAADMGRCTLNPLRHLDPIGSVVVPFLSIALLGVVVGWGRPVPINPDRVRGGWHGLATVHLAGPLANAMLVWLAILAHYATGAAWAYTVGSANLFLLIVNLLPLPWLDGGKVIALWLRHR